jgi:hypothetical protein
MINPDNAKMVDQFQTDEDGEIELVAHGRSPSKHTNQTRRKERGESLKGEMQCRCDHCILSIPKPHYEHCDCIHCDPVTAQVQRELLRVTDPLFYDEVRGTFDLVNIRTRLGWSQRQLGYMLFVSVSVIERWESKGPQYLTGLVSVVCMELARIAQFADASLRGDTLAKRLEHDPYVDILRTIFTMV